jgi:triosephosphate isomerase
MKKREPILAGNWKMNHGPAAAKTFLDQLSAVGKRGATLRIYAPFLSLQSCIERVNTLALPVEIGAQNLHAEKSGAFTGEISGPMLAEIGIRQILIGHSERRQYFGETDAILLKKTVSALEQGFEVLFCIGETLEERKSGKTLEVLRKQLEALVGHEACQSAFGKTLHLAYEPVWAIGTGLTATPEQAQETHHGIREFLKASLGVEKSDAVRILYGGSVTPQNFGELLRCPDIDGGLVGGASLKPESFRALWELLPNPSLS